MFLESLGIRRRLAGLLRTPQCDRGVTIALQRVGLCQYALGDSSSAVERFDESLRISQDLLSQYGMTSDAEDLVMAAVMRMDVERSCGSTVSAISRLESTVPVVEKLEASASAEYLDTARLFWESCAEALDSEQLHARASESRSRASLLRDRIDAIGGSEQEEELR